jgi:hypothetical protein
MADVVKAVTLEIEALPAEIRDSGLAAATIVLAERLAVASPRDAAPIGRELRESLATLRQMAEAMPSEELNELESLQDRAKRLKAV